MKKSRYRISEKAITDIESIWLYTYRNWSIEQADRYYRLIIDEIEHITTNFESGKSFDHIIPGYRAVNVKSHMIFYKKGKDGVTEIIRVLHQRMDLENRIRE